MSRNATSSQDMEKGFSGNFGSMKDFGFSGSIEGQKKSEPEAPSKPKPKEAKPKASPTEQGVDGFSQGHTNPITSQEGFAGKMPANGGFAGGGAVMGPHVHPHGQSLHRVDQGMDGSIVHHHAHGGYTTFHQDGNITHHSADGQEAVGGGTGDGAGAGSVNTHPHGHAVMRTESMPDREILRHQHGGFSVQYNDDRPPTHHLQDGTPAYHATGGDVAQDKALIKKAFAQHDKQMSMTHGGKKTHLDLARGGSVHHQQHKSKPRKPKMPKPAPMGGALSSAAPVNRPPRNPERSVSPRNEMPGGVMPYGVEPSAEPDVSDGTAGAAAGPHDPAALKKGGRVKA